MKRPKRCPHCGGARHADFASMCEPGHEALCAALAALHDRAMKRERRRQGASDAR